jgi:hypothetical protein
MKLKYRILSILAIIFIISSFVTPVLASDGDGVVELGDKLVLKGGYEATCIGFNRYGQPEYQVDLGTPVYLDDLTTKIDTEWRFDDTDKMYKSGANKFSVNVVNEYISLYDKQYNNINWSPSLSVSKMDRKLDKSGLVDGSIAAKEAKAILLSVDPINENYTNNTLMWDYGNGIKRYLRLIEGVCQEYYIVDNPIAGDLVINNNATKNTTFKNDTQLSAWDADGKPIEITTDDKYNITLSKDTALDAKIKYPITIDPDTTFESTSSDGYTQTSIFMTWANAYSWSTADYIYINNTGQITFSGVQSIGVSYMITRSFLYFNTASLSGFVITATDLKLYISSKSASAAWTLQVQSGMPTYPHDPIVYGDYVFSHYAGNGGQLASGSMSTGAYNTITLNATGYGWINTSGYTKYCLRELNHDINNSDPGGATVNNYMAYYSYEKGAGYRPQLVVTFTATAPGINVNNASSVSKTTARLNSAITDAGGDTNCEVRFGYGTTSKSAANFATYNTVTAWVAGYELSDLPYLDITGLTANTPYYYRVQIKNEHSTVTSVDEMTFTTSNAIDDVSLFYGTPSDTLISLTWAIPAGANQVLIRFAYDVYPPTTADGTQAYLGNLSSYNHTGLEAGKTVYYSIWGESGGGYSTNAFNLSLTTEVSDATDDLTVTPPDSFNQPSNSSTLSHLGAFYTIINNVATSMGMPVDNFWFFGYILMSIFGAILIFIKFKSASFTVFTLIALFGVGIFIHLLPFEMVFLEVILALGVWSLQSREAGT